ncbi:MAG TPA: exo-alpha-sialidase, partial [Rhodocyclaceae bacterium]|nr:exo-alpha-sialidase [Rhodocyclaceae bacterium]
MSMRPLLFALLLSLSPLTGAQSHGGHGERAARPELGNSALFTADGKLLVVIKEGKHLYLQRGDAEGKHWQAPIKINAQPEAIAADGESRPKLALAADGGVLVSWTKPLAKPYTGEIRFARSTDGTTFDAPITVHRDRAEITHRFESLHVTRDG